MKNNLVITLVLILITIPTLLPFLRSDFFYTQDHIFIARLHQMDTALKDGHFPVRWAPDLRAGEPLFNFYAPLPYYIGFIIKNLGFDLIFVAKILFILSSILSAFTMYILASKLFSQKAAFLASILYIYAPYRAVDLFVRGALSEAWAFIFFPLIFYTAYLLSQKINLLKVALLSFCLTGLFLTHSVMTLIFMPFFVLWVLYLYLQQRKFKLIISIFAALVLGVGIASSFLLPALFEQQFIQTKYLTVGYFDFRAHFVAAYQFFSPIWGYGSSLWGPKDDMSFQIGLAHWAALALSFWVAFVNRKNKKLLSFFIFSWIMFLISIFLQHNKSAFIWEAIPSLAFIQFPWRFLAISIFFISIIGAATSDYFKNKLQIIYIVLILAVVVLNLNYFKPRNYVENSFFDKFLNVESMKKGIDLTKDYIPIWVEGEPKELLLGPYSLNGEIEIKDFESKTAKSSFKTESSVEQIVVVPIFFFPGWQAKIDGVDQIVNPAEQGLISFNVPSGSHNVEVRFNDTPIRTAGNLISLLSLFVVVLMVGQKKWLPG